MGTSAEELQLKISGDAAGGEKAVNDITSAVERTVKSLSGDGLFGAANNVTAAISQLGGVTKLTAAEQERATSTIEKAIDKWRVMGTTAPPAVMAIREELARAGEATGGWLPLLSDLGNSWAARIAEGMLLRDAIREVINKVGEMATALPELALKGAAVADVEENFKHLTEQLGRTGDTLVGALRTGTHSTITDFELMKTANRDLTAGLNLTDQQFGTLAKGAFALAQATGGDVKTALETMNDAMLTGRTRALALLTGKIDETAAEERYAKSLGVSADHLSEAGKLEAKRIAILDGVTDATKRLGDQTDGLDERVAQVQVAWANFQENLGKTIATSPVLTAGMDAAAEAVKTAFGDSQQTLIAAVASAIDRAAISVLEFAEGGVKGVGFVGTEFNALKVVIGDIAQAFELLNLGAAKLEKFKLKSSDLFGVDPETTSRIKEIDQAIADMNTRMTARGAALQADKAAEEDWAKTGDRLADSIRAIKDRMVETSEAAAGFVGPVQSASDGQKAAADSASRHADMLQRSKDEISKTKAAAEAFAKAMTDLNAVGVGWQGTLDTIDGTVAEAIKYYLAAGVAQNQLAIAYGLTAAQVKSVESAVKAETETEKLWATMHAETFKLAQEHEKQWRDEALKAAAENNKILIGNLDDEMKYRQQHADAVLKLSATTFDVQRTQAIEWMLDEKRKLVARGGDWSKAWEELQLVAHDKMTVIAMSEQQMLDTMHAQESTWANGLEKLLGGFPDLMIKGLTGGGGVSGIGSALTSGLGALGGEQLITKPLTSLFNSAAPTLLNSFGSTVTTAIGGAIPLIGPAIGALAPILLGSLKKLFGGPSQEELDGRKVEASFEQSFGGFQKMMDAVGKAYADTGRGAQQAQADVKALMDAEKQGGTATQTMIDKINAAFADEKTKAADVSKAVDGIVAAAQSVGGTVPAALQPMLQKLIDGGGLTDDLKGKLLGLTDAVEPSINDLTSAASRYGLSLDSIGGKAAQLSISTQADQITRDWKSLVVTENADSDKVLAGMKDSLNKLAAHAMDTGSVLPTALEPLVQQLFKTGQLTDTAGNKITDLSKLKFDDAGDPLAKGVSALTTAITHLNDLLDPKSPTGLAANATSTASAMAAALAKPIPPPWADWGSPPSVPDYGGAIPMADGGSFRVTRPTLFLAGEKPGGEDVAFSGAGKSFRGGGMGGGGVTVQVTVEGNVWTERDLVESLSQGIADKMQQSGALPFGVRR